jgi:hypothetical protein
LFAQGFGDRLVGEVSAVLSLDDVVRKFQIEGTIGRSLLPSFLLRLDILIKDRDLFTLRGEEFLFGCELVLELLGDESILLDIAVGNTLDVVE